jgi:predicted metal-dependent enzyme (double-stranded beta helix superfamily)
MVNINEIAPFPNVGVQLIKEDEHVAIWKEVFEPGKPTPPHRHMRDYIAIFPNGGELTIVPLAGEGEENTTIAGGFEEKPTEKGGTRWLLSKGTMIHGKVPEDGTGHFAVNEGQQDTLMILIEIKGTGTEKRAK